MRFCPQRQHGADEQQGNDDFKQDHAVRSALELAGEVVGSSLERIIRKDALKVT